MPGWRVDNQFASLLLMGLPYHISYRNDNTLSLTAPHAEQATKPLYLNKCQWKISNAWFYDENNFKMEILYVKLFDRF